MKRTVDVELYGKTYPLCCSLGAIEELSERYGDLDKFMKAARAGNTSDVLTLFEIFMKHGCRRARQFEGVEIEPIENVRDYLDLSDVPIVSQKVVEAIMLSQKNEVKGEATGKKKEE